MLPRLLFGIVLLSLVSGSAGQQAIGQWTDQLSYIQARSIVEANELVYCASVRGIFSHNTVNGELRRFSKVNGLSDIGVTAMEYSNELNALVLGYSNGNLDIMRGDDVQNLSDIRLENIIGDKAIYQIDIEGVDAWLSCGFGIVKVDLEDLEVKDTYIIGSNGSNLRVNDILLDGEYVIAATDEGILKALLSSNLADFTNWSPMAEGLSEPNAPFGEILRLQENLFTFSTGENTELFKHDGNMWELVDGASGYTTQSISAQDETLLIANRFFIQFRNAQGEFLSNIGQYPFEDLPKIYDAEFSQQGELLIADENHGLVIKDGEEFTSIKPSSPFTDVVWKAKARKGELWLAHGELKSNFDNVFSDQGFSGLNQGDWIRTAREPIFDTVRDLVDVELDLFDPNKVHFAAFKGGLLTYMIDEGNYLLQNVDDGNSTIEYGLLNSERIHASSLEYDFGGNLWVTNSYTPEGWKILKTDGSWVSMGCPTELTPLTLYGDMVITELGQTWTILPRGNGLVVLQHENEIISSNSHPCKKLTTAVGGGGLPTNTTLSIAEDLDGEIWLGTSEGPVVNYSPQSIFSNNPTDFQPILVERDGNVERLLGSESITAIEVDGANRKWIGTLNGGVFLLSEDGTEEIHHFTKENSPLFSNVIKDIAIDPDNGQVHFATNAGTISYMSDATLGEEENECYDVYPNPVRPEYYGPVTIEGLKAESEVKITDIAGNIVFQTISNGGRAVWQGTDFSGDRVSTGVYFALVSDRDGESTCISKILFVN